MACQGPAEGPPRGAQAKVAQGVASSAALNCAESRGPVKYPLLLLRYGCLLWGLIRLCLHRGEGSASGPRRRGGCVFLVWEERRRKSCTRASAAKAQHPQVLAALCCGIADSLPEPVIDRCPCVLTGWRRRWWWWRRWRGWGSRVLNTVLLSHLYARGAGGQHMQEVVEEGCAPHRLRRKDSALTIMRHLCAVHGDFHFLIALQKETVKVQAPQGKILYLQINSRKSATSPDR